MMLNKQENTRTKSFRYTYAALQTIQKCMQIVELTLLSRTGNQFHLLRKLTELEVPIGSAQENCIGTLRIDRLQLARSRLTNQISAMEKNRLNIYYCTIDATDG